ncbi:SHAN3 protein, partial [Pomatorhinus ruficollis]|nr:SHAN3 protein [Pomatorhinus ruficollis]
ESPLTAAAQLEPSTDMIKALRNGGAHLDFRTREGMTALHKAVRCRNHAALLVTMGMFSWCPWMGSSHGSGLLVSVGGIQPWECSPGVRGWGWQEIHQACRYGHVQHLEHLLFYGADMTAQNASGNTALHICALYNQ